MDYRIKLRELKPLEALKMLRQNSIDDTHLFDDELFNVIEPILKALEIIKETPEFAWYITIYKNAYEMVSEVEGFRVYNSVEELQEMFDLLKEVLK